MSRWAHNAGGGGAWALISNPVLPGRPSAPALDGSTPSGATPGDGELVITFGAPQSDGGSTITGFTASCVRIDVGLGDATTVSASGASSPITVTGLTNGARTDAGFSPRMPMVRA